MPSNPSQMPTLPPAGATTNTPAPIGVPEYVLGPDGQPIPYYATREVTQDYGYEVRRPGTTGLTYQPQNITRTQAIPPSFFEGDDIGFLFSLRPDALAALQSQLTQAGLLDPDSYQPGFVGGASNDPTVQAIQVVMSYGNRAGYKSVSDALSAYVASGFGAVGSKGYDASQNARLAAPVSNADDLRRVFRAAVIDTLGTGWSEGQIDAMISDYQAHERAYNQHVAAGEAVDESLATPETFAVDTATTADPTSAQSQQFLEAAGNLSSMLGRWSGG